MGHLIETDSRGRTNLSRFSRNGRFLARQEEDGTIVLSPVRLVTPGEDRFMRNPSTVEKVRKAEERIEDAVVLDLGQ